MLLESLNRKRVKHDILNARGVMIVPAQTLLNEWHLKLIQQHQIDIREISIISDEKVESSELIIKKASNYSKELFNQIQVKTKIPVMEIKHELVPLIQQVSENHDLFHLFESVKAKDEYTHQHNIGVGVLSTLIGKWLELDEKEIALLSLAAVMHDVGKVRISEDILMKPGKLTNEEFEEMKRHTVYGYQILKETTGLSPRVANVALQHHERINGKGYPLKLQEHQVDPMSLIVAVADVFHAMSSKRPYHEPLPFFQVVSQMRKGFFGELAPRIVAVFLNNLTKSLIGRKITLTNGQKGEVVYINPHDDINPLVKVGDSFVDLSHDQELHIQDIVV
ncbi:HD-GYP domain-containing protein [Paenibacillus albus]|uniref:HD-GYP domain-containing protein n=1 Tax=Paenibacillus albus TaxID=2495582 RepID=A0A3S8ZZQ3_9BACL|nr:HD-GYP domain-containing protein [Paenibacillus albus]AZN38981.1 HD-GYP domain-containing protein [Paenibacillus albus]